MTNVLNLGIYFGLPADEYHADPGLGSGDQKDFALDPFDAQFERINATEEDEEETPSLIAGRALHARVLEGPEAFAREFPIKPSKDDYPGCLVTMDDLRAYGREIGVAKLGKTKAEAVASIRAADAVIPIWDEIEAAFAAKTEGRTPISAQLRHQVETAARWMQEDHLLGPVMENGVFNAGASEVSIFYERDGIRCKARWDHIFEHREGAFICDLKTFRPKRKNGKLKAQAISAISEFRYDLQAHSYIAAWHAAKDLAAAGGHVHGEPPYPTFLGRFFAHEEPRWLWVMVKMSRAPQPIVFDWRPGGFNWANGRHDLEAGLTRYAELMRELGPDREWPPRYPAEILQDDGDWPAWHGR